MHAWIYIFSKTVNEIQSYIVTSYAQMFLPTNAQDCTLIKSFELT